MRWGGVERLSSNTRPDAVPPLFFALQDKENQKREHQRMKARLLELEHARQLNGACTGRDVFVSLHLVVTSRTPPSRACRDAQTPPAPHPHQLSLSIFSDRAESFHRRINFLREQHAKAMLHTEERQARETKQVLESQDMEARNLRMMQVRPHTCVGHTQAAHTRSHGLKLRAHVLRTPDRDLCAPPRTHPPTHTRRTSRRGRWRASSDRLPPQQAT